MDNLTLMLTAIERATITRGQAVPGDTVTEALLQLKNLLLQQVSDKTRATFILNEYEEDPATWQKPIQELVIKSALDQNAEALLLAEQILTRSGYHSKDQPGNTFHGSVQNAIIGDNNTNTFNITNQTPTPANPSIEGQNNLKRAFNALLQGDYTTATRCLEKASEQLFAEQLPAEVAQMKYLQAIAELHAQRPFKASIQRMRYVEQQIQLAIDLNPLYSYFYTLSLFKRDFARNGLPGHLRDALALDQKAHKARRTRIDEDNLKLLARCQPQLMSDSRRW